MLPCTFRVEITLDMSGCIVASLRDTQAAGYRRQPGGLILASDANRGGAIFIEIEPRAVLDPALVRIEGDLLVRALTPGMGRLREDVEELVHWATELDTEVDNFFVSFCAAEGPRSFRPTRVIAQLSPQQLVEPFEVLAQRQYFVRGGASVGW